jgi:hypothetical protein
MRLLQKAIISLTCTNWLAFVGETDCFVWGTTSALKCRLDCFQASKDSLCWSVCALPNVKEISHNIYRFHFGKFIFLNLIIRTSKREVPSLPKSHVRIRIDGCNILLAARQLFRQANICNNHTQLKIIHPLLFTGRLGNVCDCVCVCTLRYLHAITILPQVAVLYAELCHL